QALLVGVVALDLLGLKLIFKRAQFVSRVEGGLHRGLGLCQSHPAERLIGRERLPPVDDAHDLFQCVFRLWHEAVAPELSFQGADILFSRAKLATEICAHALNSGKYVRDLTEY